MVEKTKNNCIGYFFWVRDSKNGKIMYVGISPNPPLFLIHEMQSTKSKISKWLRLFKAQNPQILDKEVYEHFYDDKPLPYKKAGQHRIEWGIYEYLSDENSTQTERYYKRKNLIEALQKQGECQLNAHIGRPRGSNKDVNIMKRKVKDITDINHQIRVVEQYLQSLYDEKKAREAVLTT